MDRAQSEKDFFAQKVAEALDQIPQEFRERMENVEILIEEFPDRETLVSMGIQSKWGLLGLYVGVPLSNRSFFSTSVLPETIILYRKPIMRAAQGIRDLSAVVREVIIHELGHHFGFTDDELYSMTGPDE
jgi:acetylglutamate kinase